MGFEKIDLHQQIETTVRYWKEECKEFENMELSPENARRYRAAIRSELRPIRWRLSRDMNSRQLEQTIDHLEKEVYIAITKGENIYRENEADRFSTKYGTSIGPVLNAIHSFCQMVIIIILKSLGRG